MGTLEKTCDKIMDGIYTITGVSKLVKKMDETKYFDSLQHGIPEKNQRNTKAAYLGGTALLLSSMVYYPPMITHAIFVYAINLLQHKKKDRSRDDLVEA